MIKSKIFLGIFFCLWLPGTFTLVAQDTITVFPNEYSRALRNPLKGFRQNLNDADDPEYIYTTIVRDYIRWNEIENSENDGVQKIIDFCNNRWQGLEDLNVKVIPRVYIEWHDSNGDEYWPADIVDSLGWDPWDVRYWSSDLVKRRVTELVYKLGEAWDNDPRVAWIQTGLIGYWGEQENPVGVDEEGWAERLGEAFDSAFHNKKLLVRNQRYWDPAGFKMGVYWDSYGHPGQTSGSWTDIRNTNAQGRFLTEVVEGEVAYNWGEDRFDPLYGGEPEITLNDNQYTDNMIDVIRELHCSGLGWISSYFNINSGLNVNRDNIAANADRMQKSFGYRYLIPEFNCLSRVDQGDTLYMNFKVKNTGSAPFYSRWPVAFTLIEETTKQIIWTAEIPDVDITQWEPGENYNYSTRMYNNPAPEVQVSASIAVPENIPTGQYMAGISILDQTTGLPGIFFAVENFLSESQSQPLCRMAVGEDLIGEPDIDPSVFGDPLEDDARFYSLSDGLKVQITYPSDGASFSPPAAFPVYVSAYKKKSGAIDSVKLYVNGVPEHTLYASPYIFNVSDLSAGVWSLEAIAYAEGGAVQSDPSVVSIQIPGGLPWLENFDLPNGTRSDEGETAWTSSRGGGIFEVSNGAFKVSDGKTYVGEFVTGAIHISAAPVTVSLDVAANDGGLDAGEDYVKLYKIIDGGAEVLIDMVDGKESKTFMESNITGDSLRLMIRGYTTYNGEVYRFDNLSVRYDVEPPTKDITLLVNGFGTVDPPEGIHSYYEGQTVTLTAAPGFGYEFDSWSGDLSGTSNPQELLMDADKTVAANFTELPVYTLATSAANGSITLSQAGGTYYEGTRVTLTATPASGFRFTGWSGDFSGSENPVTVTMDGNKNITANFEEIPAYILTVTAINGSVSLDPGGGSYLEGTGVTLTATPETGYEFTGWSGDTTGTANPCLITMDADKSITANFDFIIAIPEHNLPTHTTLGRNRPNPFRTQTTIPYQLSEASHIKLSIYNVLGIHVATLVNDYQDPGFYTVDWKVTDPREKMSPGAVYIYRLETEHDLYMRMFIHRQ